MPYRLPTSYAQDQLWLAARLEPDTPLYHLRLPADLPFALTDDQVRAALATVVDRHETLRTALVEGPDGPEQVVYETVPIDLDCTDLRGLPPGERETRERHLHLALAPQPLRLDEAPLWRARAVRLGDAAWRLLFVVHHAVIDATSMLNLRRELTEAARSIVDGRAPRLPDLPVQYADYAAWQRGQADGDGVAHWQKTLRDLPADHGLPADHPRPATPTYAAGTVPVTIDAGTADAVHRLAVRHRATPFVVLLAAYQATIARLAGTTDVVVGTFVAGRELPETAPLIGMFVNRVALRTDLSGDPTFGDLLDRVRGVVADALDHQSVPLELVATALAQPRVPGRHPVFQLGVNFLPRRGYAGGAADDRVDFRDDPAGASAVALDLHLEVYEREAGFAGVVEFSRDRFEPATVSSFVDRLVRMLDAAVRDPARQLSELPLLDDDERTAILARAEPVRPTVAPVVAPVAPVDTAAVAPVDTAAVAPVDTAGAGAVAALLAAAGVTAGQVVGCLLPTATAGPAQVGVLRAGAVVVPLDPAQPPPRSRFVLTDARAVAVVTDHALRDRVPTLPGVSVLCVEDAAPAPAPDAAGSAVLAYRTSGTGLPKGVVVTRDGLVAVADGLRALLGAGPADTWDLLIPVHHPVFTAVHLAGAARVHNGPTDHLVASATALPTTDPPPRRTLLVLDDGTDPGAADHALPALTEWAAPAAVYWCYSRPELSGAGPVRRPDDPPGTLGRSFWPVAAHVLDAHGGPVPDRTPGELYLGGPAVAAGYHGRAAATGEAFSRGGTLFRTGLRATVDGDVISPV